MALARGDIFVKAINGYAVAGAQVYICTQPANTLGVPPSPLATIYGDINGITSLANPLTTDGFGHAYYYASFSQLYTIVTVFNGQILEVLPDQALNANGNNVVVFSTNGTQNTLQSLLNLLNGLNITLTADSQGDVTVAVANWNVDIAAYTPGTLSNSQELLRYNVTHSITIPANFSGSYASSDVASAGNVSCIIKKNGSQIATISFNTSSTGSFSTQSAINCSPGDVVTVFGPSSADANLAGVSFTVVTNRTA